MIYADNAATTQLAPEALDAMMPYLKNEYGNISQPYSFSRSAKKAVLEARKTIADCINAEPEEIYFTSGGTESDNWALKGIMFEAEDKKALITTQIEHHAVLNSAAAIRKRGYAVTYLPVNEYGILLPEVLEEHITNDVKLVSVMCSNNEVGTIEPIKELAILAHQHGAIFHTDAVQAVGHIPLDVKDLQVDILSASGHKFNGPKGIGFLYINKKCSVKSLIDGGAQEYGMRAGTENVASIVGMACALKLNVLNISSSINHLLKMEHLLISKLNNAKIDYLRNGSLTHVPGNISLSFKGIEGEMLLHRLDLKGICVSTGSACDSVNTQTSHVIRAIKVPEEYAIGTIRISLGKNNTEEEVNKIADEIIKIIKGR